MGSWLSTDAPSNDGAAVGGNSASRSSVVALQQQGVAMAISEAITACYGHSLVGRPPIGDDAPIDAVVEYLQAIRHEIDTCGLIGNCRHWPFDVNDVVPFKRAVDRFMAHASSVRTGPAFSRDGAIIVLQLDELFRIVNSAQVQQAFNGPATASAATAAAVDAVKDSGVAENSGGAKEAQSSRTHLGVAQARRIMIVYIRAIAWKVLAELKIDTPLPTVDEPVVKQFRMGD